MLDAAMQMIKKIDKIKFFFKKCNKNKSAAQSINIMWLWVSPWQ